MNMRLFSSRIPLLIFISMALISCSSSIPVLEAPDNFSPSDADPVEILSTIPDYSDTFYSTKGRGRAFVSEPGNSDRFSIEFEGDTTLSLMTVTNRIGIEGGYFLVDRDSILIYNKVDKIAQKISITDSRLTSLNELASINFMDLLNYKVVPERIVAVLESDDEYLFLFSNDGSIRVSKANGVVLAVEEPLYSRFPYSKIIYEDHAVIDGYILPRKITIFSNDGDSKALLQIRSLTINPDKLSLVLDIPDDVYIERL